LVVGAAQQAHCQQRCLKLINSIDLFPAAGYVLLWAGEGSRRRTAAVAAEATADVVCTISDQHVMCQIAQVETARVLPRLPQGFGQWALTVRVLGLIAT
jgi:hypothetical protein